LAKHLLLALTNPVEGRDAEFNDWYDNVAYPTYKSLPGLVPLGRFKAANVPHMFPFQRKNEYKYLSVYYFEADDPSVYISQLKESFTEKTDYNLSSDIDTGCFFEPIFTAISDVNFDVIDRFEDLKR